MLKSELNIQALYFALKAKKDVDDMSWRDLAHAIDVSPSTFTRMAQGNKPDVDTFARFIQWLGVKADDFLGGNKQKEDVDPVAMFSAHLRADRNMSPKDADALEDILNAAYKMLKRNG